MKEAPFIINFTPAGMGEYRFVNSGLFSDHDHNTAKRILVALIRRKDVRTESPFIHYPVHINGVRRFYRDLWQLGYFKFVALASDQPEIPLLLFSVIVKNFFGRHRYKIRYRHYRFLAGFEQFIIIPEYIGQRLQVFAERIIYLLVHAHLAHSLPEFLVHFAQQRSGKSFLNFGLRNSGAFCFFIAHSFLPFLS